MKGVSLFSSAGIAETYFEEIGLNIQVANEIEKKRCEFFEYMYPNTKMICGDIQNSEVKKEIIKYSIDKQFLIATPNVLKP